MSERMSEEMSERELAELLHKIGPEPRQILEQFLEELDKMGSESAQKAVLTCALSIAEGYNQARGEAQDARNK